MSKNATNKLWLFRQLNLSLRLEIIVNIALLMLVAILLIGFSISKIIETNILQEKVRNGEGMVSDVQTAIDFITRERKEFTLDHPLMKKGIQDYVHLYARRRGIQELMVLDHGMKVVASERPELLDTPYSGEKVKEAIRTGQIQTKIEKTGRFISVEYKRLILSAPLWVRGKLAGGLQMEVPIWDVTEHLQRSQRMIVIPMALHAVVLIIFGSFLLSRVLVKPIKELVQLTRRIDEGDFSHRIEVTSRNEIGQLIAAFNQMIDRLKENQENLENHLTSLELKNKQLKQAQEELMRT